MIKFNGEPKKVNPGMSVQQFFNLLGQQGQVSDYNWFVNDQQVQLTADQKVTTAIKIGTNVRLEPIQSNQQPPTQLGGFNLAPSFISDIPVQKVQPNNQNNLGPTYPNLGRIPNQVPVPPSNVQQTEQPIKFDPTKMGININPLIVKPLVTNTLERKQVQKSGQEKNEKQFKNFNLEILDYGHKVTLTKLDESFQASLFEEDSTPEITKIIQSSVRPTDLISDELQIVRLNDTKVMFTKDYKGIIVRWRTNMASKLEFWLEDD